MLFLHEKSVISSLQELCRKGRLEIVWTELTLTFDPVTQNQNKLYEACKQLHFLRNSWCIMEKVSFV